MSVMTFYVVTETLDVIYSKK